MSSFFEQRRERRLRARRLRELGDCPECRHPWLEHFGTGNDMAGTCGECAYEFEHEQRESSAPGAASSAHLWVNSPVAADECIRC